MKTKQKKPIKQKTIKKSQSSSKGAFFSKLTKKKKGIFGQRANHGLFPRPTGSGLSRSRPYLNPASPHVSSPSRSLSLSLSRSCVLARASRRHDAAAAVAAAARHGRPASAAAGRGGAAAAVGRDPAADAAAPVRRAAAPAAAGDVGPAPAAGALRAGAPAPAVLRRATAAGDARPRGRGRGEDALDRRPAALDGRELHLQLLRGHRGGTGPDLL